MKVIVIKDEDAMYLLEKIKFEALRLADGETQEEKSRIQKIHRALHYHVCRWLQEHGADVIAKQ